MPTRSLGGWLLTAVLALIPGGLAWSAPTATAREGSIGVQVADLQEQLEDGLRARLPSEFAFLERVVAMVEDGQLPLDLVRSTFAWARRKRPHPFPYFERALRLRAAAIGIKIPPYIYGSPEMLRPG